MRCEKVREHFADYLTNALSGPVGDEVAGHLAACEACRAEADELRSVWEKLGWIPEGQTDSAAMRARLDSLIAAQESAPTPLRPVPARRRVLMYAAVVALLALMTFAGLRGLRWGADPPNRAPAAPETTIA